MRNEIHSQHPGGDIASFFRTLCQFDAAAFSTSACVYLRLDDNHVAAQFFGGVCRPLLRSAPRFRAAQARRIFVKVPCLDIHESSLFRLKR